MKKLQTPEQTRRMWRDAAIRKKFKEYMSVGSSKMSTYEQLAVDYKLTVSQIRNIVKNKKTKSV